MNRYQGFSLVELAMVLFIISLVVGGLLVPLASQMEARQRNAAVEQLERIKEALIGYALVNGHLPCHSTTSDPASSLYGEEDQRDPTTERCVSAELTPGWEGDGILPWKTLGMANGLDPWGVNRTDDDDPWVGHWRYRVYSPFTDQDDRFSLNTQSNDPTTDGEMLCIVDSEDNLLVSLSETPIAIVYSMGADGTADGENASYERISPSDDCVTIVDPDNPPIRYQGGPVSGEFDDITVWLTRPLLFSRMVTAGRLP